MTYKEIEKFLLTLPHATMSIQWGADRVFKVGGKMFAVIGGHEGVTGAYTMSFKASEESFEILTKEAGFVPAPYLARAKWLALDKPSRLSAKDMRAYLTRAHALVAAKLPKKKQKEMGLL